MSIGIFDNSTRRRVATLVDRVLNGEAIGRSDALWILSLREPRDIYELLVGANYIREAFHGKKVYFCSIYNVKSGGCPEDCKFCAQSARYSTPAPRYDVVERDEVLKVMGDVKANKAGGFGLVAAWPELTMERLVRLEPVLQAVYSNHSVELHASLGMITKLEVAERLRELGVVCYNHNLETSARYFPRICTTHSYEKRISTLRILKKVGIKVCSGGIIGLGEDAEDRVDLGLTLRGLDVDVVPINILTPIPGTPLEDARPVPPLEALKVVACFRFIMPRQHILIAGGRPGNLRDLQSLALIAGATGLMVGNYLTTQNRPASMDLQMVDDLKLEIVSSLEDIIEGGASGDNLA